MDVIITGANGFIGSKLVNKFIENGDNVYAIVKDRSEDISRIRLCKHIIFSETDHLGEQIDLFAGLHNPVFYHLAWAGVNGKEKSDYVVQTKNISMACDSAIFAKKINASCFLCAGTIAEEGVRSFSRLPSISRNQLYAVSKKSARLFLEVICKSIELPFVWMRFSNIYGPENKTGNLISYTLAQLESSKEATFGPADQPYDFVFVDDLIEAVYLLGKRGRHCYTDYFIGSGKPRILKDYINEIGLLTGKSNLIKIGVRPDDGIKYSFKMFDIQKTVSEIGNYVAKDFDAGMRFTIDNY